MAERAKGVWNGKEVSFFSEICGHTLTDSEVEALCNGETITLTGLVSKKGNTFDAPAKLVPNKWTDRDGNEHDGVKVDLVFDEVTGVPASWAGHTFSQDEKDLLEAGQIVHLTGIVSKRTGNTYDTEVVWGIASDGKKKIVPSFADDYQSACENAGLNA